MGYGLMGRNAVSALAILHARHRGHGPARTVQAWKSALGSLRLDGHPARWRSLSPTLRTESRGFRSVGIATAAPKETALRSEG